MVSVPLIFVAVRVPTPLRFVMFALVAVRLVSVPTLVILGWAAVVNVPLILVAVNVLIPLRFVMLALVAVRFVSVPTLVILG